MGGAVSGVRSIASGVDTIAGEYDKLDICGVALHLWVRLLAHEAGQRVLSSGPAIQIFR